MTKRVKIKFNLKPEAIICDVDGTVALMHGNRGHLIGMKFGVINLING